MKIVFIILFFLAGDVGAHGGEDHGVASSTSMPVSSTGQLKLVSYPGNLEVLVKYPAPVLNEPVTGRIYFADYATNHPVDPTSLELSFPGAFATKVTKQPTKISDGVYEFSVIFTRDTSHTALLKLSVNNIEQLTTLSPFFAGTSATRQMAAATASLGDAEHATETKGSTISTWLILLILAVVAGLAFALLRNRRKRIAVVTTSTSSDTVTNTTSKTSDL